MTVEEAYAAPVAPKRRRSRAFAVGLVVGVVAGAVAVLLLNRAAEAGESEDEEPVVELQPALAGDTATVTRLPVTPLGSRRSIENGAGGDAAPVAATRSEGEVPPVIAAVPPTSRGGETERHA